MSRETSVAQGELRATTGKLIQHEGLSESRMQMLAEYSEIFQRHEGSHNVIIKTLA